MNMKNTICLGMLSASALCANAAAFYPITSIDHNMESPEANSKLAGGPGVGFDASAPHSRTGDNNWDTQNFGKNYIAEHQGLEYFWFDLGSNVPLDEISYWG